nr:inositol monophosphatase family protein (HISN) [Polytomella parva]|mmetsp:Transcript_7765/g.15167  ORF Transcript_7765/g.15167 Transcript_7765/m.15167 type:complete len:321 (-) Transcript_7765:460-1422(-)|eukprot:CAMPEP_0175039654 /NCGR_PEP_ID=MMETSP0052_2-20121109/736_1 /TAXON_ID=51329 ORGANISM="Polytomella parva, Strain SAG 63-3" /NCGR_SAMPLE_ID=MMETSP0052_2 /ASSEMBLY_ACC=CAM_ASM_000194 /LENGTH=320 /DNA_ID=CAMNT_0016301595 /DNA_START=54 /DNA_END=1016 /DNA_ORIENTATION=-
MLARTACRSFTISKKVNIIKHARPFPQISVKAVSSATAAVAQLDNKNDFKIEKYIAVANKLADVAAKVTLKYFRTKFDVEIKSDNSPVTIADKETEAAMRSVLEVECPSHGIFGEEHGILPGSGDGARYTWVLDPIDGTKSFITGKPVFGTLISLLYDGCPILGIIDQPYTRERWVGADGYPSLLNGEVISTRTCSSLAHAYLYTTSPQLFSGPTEIAFERLRKQVRITLYGCDCYAYGLLAAGHCDVVAEALLKPYDYMALVPIVKGAGGMITDWEGRELVWNPSGKGSREKWPEEVLAAGTPELHQRALEALAFRPRN